MAVGQRKAVSVYRNAVIGDRVLIAANEHSNEIKHPPLCSNRQGCVIVQQSNALLRYQSLHGRADPSRATAIWQMAFAVEPARIQHFYLIMKNKTKQLSTIFRAHNERIYWRCVSPFLLFQGVNCQYKNRTDCFFVDC